MFLTYSNPFHRSQGLGGVYISRQNASRAMASRDNSEYRLFQVCRVITARIIRARNLTSALSRATYYYVPKFTSGTSISRLTFTPSHTTPHDPTLFSVYKSTPPKLQKRTIDKESHHRMCLVVQNSSKSQIPPKPIS